MQTRETIEQELRQVCELRQTDFRGIIEIYVGYYQSLNEVKGICPRVIDSQCSEINVTKNRFFVTLSYS